MASKDVRSSFEVRNDADLQAIQTSVAFKNISDAIEQYRRQFGLAFLALIAFSAIHVGLVVIANLYTMETRVSGGVLTSTADPTGKAVATSSAVRTFDLNYVMTNMDESSQLRALNNLKSTNFVDREGNYRQYTVTGFQLGGWKRSELKLYTSVGHILNFVRGKGLQVFNENGTTCNCTAERKMLADPPAPPPLSDTAKPSPPPPFPPGYTMNTHNMDHDNEGWGINLGWLQGNNTAEQVSLAATIAAATDTDTIYSQKMVATLAEAANAKNKAGNNMEGGVRETSAETFFGDENWATKSGSEESAASKEANYVDEIATWGNMDGANQDATISGALSLGINYANATAQNIEDGNAVTSFASYAVANSGVEANDFVSADQTNSTDAVFAKVSLVAAEEEADYLQGQNFWDDQYAMYQMFETVQEDQNSTMEYACANGLDACNSNTALAAYYASADGASTIAYLNTTGTPATGDVSSQASAAQENVTNWVQNQVTHHGGQAAWGSSIVNTIIVKVYDVLEVIDEAYSNYKVNGYIAWDETLNMAAVPASSYTTRTATHYGCTGETFAELNVDPNGPMVNVLSACIQSAASGDVEPYTTGQFFSKSLGYFERFSMYTPPILCSELTSMSPAPSTIASYRQTLSGKGLFTEYVYMLHGWGGDEGFLHMMSVALEYVFDTSHGHHVGAVDGFVVVAPADGSTPFAAKTWYFNNDFTGFHMDMIVFELQSFVTNALGLHLRAQGAYGFSMGGWGCMHISMTYPNEFQAIGAFNAPILPNSCFWTDVCHLECGVDFIMCELMWTTISVGLNPYVIAIADQILDSDGSYSPVALGNLANIVGNGDAGGASLLYGGFLASGASDKGTGAGGKFYGQEIRCLEGAYVAPANMVVVAANNGDTVTVASGFMALNVVSSTAQVANMRYFGYDMTSDNFNIAASGTKDICGSGVISCPMSSVLSWVFEQVAWDPNEAYFYLDPVTFTQSSQYFNPTHNSVSGVRNHHNQAFGNFALQMPYLRMSSHGTVFLNYPLWFLISCDHNDQMGPSPDTDKFVSLLIMYGNDAGNHFNAGFGWVYDKFDSKGHSFSQRDIRLAIQWMSDAFRTFTGLGDLMPTGTTGAKAGEWSDNMKTMMKDITWSGTQAPCYLNSEWKDYFGAWSANGQTWVNSGGSFNHAGNCDTSLYPTGTVSLTYDVDAVYDVDASYATNDPYSSMFAPTNAAGARKLSADMKTESFTHPGPPTGIYADQIDATHYHVASHAMEGGPSHEAVEHLAEKVADSGKFADKTATGADDLTADVATCWSFIGHFDSNGDYVAASAVIGMQGTVTLKQSTCCTSGGWQCLQYITQEYGWQGTDCCKSSTWSSWMTDNKGNYVSPLFSSSVVAEMTTIAAEAKEAYYDVYEMESMK